MEFRRLRFLSLRFGGGGGGWWRRASVAPCRSTTPLRLKLASQAQVSRPSSEEEGGDVRNASFRIKTLNNHRDCFRKARRGHPTAGKFGNSRHKISRRPREGGGPARSEEHTSELQSLMRNSYAVFCLKK